MERKQSLEFSYACLFSVGHEQLFSELTPEASAAIKGGAVLQVIKIKCQDTGERKVNQPCLFVNGMEVWSEKVMPGKEVQIDKFINFMSAATIQLYDKDCGSNDDLIDSFLISEGASAEIEKPIIGNESKKKCLLSYRVFGS